MPAVDLDGATIAESVFIVDRLEARHPQASLWPVDAAQRSVDRLWDCFATDSLYWQGIGGRTQQDVETSFATSIDMILAGLGSGPFLHSRSEPGRGDLAIAAHVAQRAGDWDMMGRGQEHVGACW